MQFKGLTFAHATWLGPSQPLGFPEASYNKYAHGSGGEVQQPAHVTFFATRDLLLEGNTFIYVHHIGVEYPGAVGLWKADSQNTTVIHIRRG